MCFTKLACYTVKIYFFICSLTIHLVELGGFLPIGWNSKVFLLFAAIASTLVDNGKSLFLGGMSLIFFVDYNVGKT